MWAGFALFFCPIRCRGPQVRKWIYFLQIHDKLSDRSHYIEFTYSFLIFLQHKYKQHAKIKAAPIILNDTGAKMIIATPIITQQPAMAASCLKIVLCLARGSRVCSFCCSTREDSAICFCTAMFFFCNTASEKSDRLLAQRRYVCVTARCTGGAGRKRDGPAVRTPVMSRRSAARVTAT